MGSNREKIREVSIAGNWEVMTAMEDKSFVVNGED